MKKLKNPLKYPLVYIEWEDAISNSGWFDQEEFDDWKNNKGFIVHEVGWIIEENKTYIVLASRYHPQDNDKYGSTSKWGMLQKIPKTWIKKHILLSANRNGEK